MAVSQWFRKERAIVWLLLLALAIRLITVFHYGLNLTLHSDDQGYTTSAIRFLKSGMFTYYSAHYPTLHMMPGITFLLAFVFWIFGTGATGIYAAKIMMTILSIISLYGVYLIGKRVWGRTAALIGVFLIAFYLPEIETSALLLTETPFYLSSVYLVYYAIRFAEERRAAFFYLAIVFYLVGVFFRPTNALYPLVVLIYVLWKKYPVKSLVKHGLIGAVIVLAVMSPWWIRNYHDFHHFVPLTDGTGNPLLLGTYQGYHYPPPSINVTLERIQAAHPQMASNIPKNEYQWFNYQTQAAISRMKLWWHQDKAAFLYSYLVYKPILLWKDPFYWLQLFHIPKSVMTWFQWKLVVLGILGYVIAWWKARRSRPEVFLILATLAYYTALYAIYFAYGRYNEPTMPFVLLGIGVGLTALFARRRGTTQSED